MKTDIAKSIKEMAESHNIEVSDISYTIEMNGNDDVSCCNIKFCVAGLPKSLDEIFPDQVYDKLSEELKEYAPVYLKRSDYADIARLIDEGITCISYETEIDSMTVIVEGSPNDLDAYVIDNDRPVYFDADRLQSELDKIEDSRESSRQTYII